MEQHWQRIFAYITGSVVFGLLIVIFTFKLIGYAAYPGWKGYMGLIGFGLIFLNFAYVVNRRFTLKRKNPSRPLSYLMGGLMVLPTLFWIFTKETGLGSSRTLFALVVLASILLGTHFGITSGIKRRAAWLKQKREENREDTPGDLRQPPDELSKN